jgi:NifU-like protein involved in Fe-S cluster formation
VNYSELTKRYFESAAGAGVLTGPGTLRGAAGSRAQGTWVQFDVQLDPAGPGETIRAVRFLAYACPHVIAVSAWIAETAVGMSASAALPEGLPQLRERFTVPVEKLGRLLIVEDAWVAAVKPCLSSVRAGR